MATIGSTSVPVKLLHEGEGHPVSVELRTGDMYRGQLVQVRGGRARPVDNTHTRTNRARAHHIIRTTRARAHTRTYTHSHARVH
jgi:hypothetical protein